MIPHDLIAKQMTEKELMQSVIDMAQFRGWKVAHFRPAPTGRVDQNGKPIWVTPVQADGRGFPDLLMIRGPQALAVETKVQSPSKGKITPEQQIWLDGLSHVLGITSFVWRPSDWLDGTIQKVLS